MKNARFFEVYNAHGYVNNEGDDLRAGTERMWDLVNTIRLAEMHDGEIRLLIVDVIMPEMNGRDLARQLVGLYPQMACLFISGYSGDVIAHHGLLEDGIHFIQKPFAMQDLASKVRQVLDGD